MKVIIICDAAPCRFVDISVPDEPAVFMVEKYFFTRKMEVACIYSYYVILGNNFDLKFLGWNFM